MVIFHSYVKLPEGIQVFVGVAMGIRRNLDWTWLDQKVPNFFAFFPVPGMWEKQIMSGHFLAAAQGCVCPPFLAWNGLGASENSQAAEPTWLPYVGSHRSHPFALDGGCLGDSDAFAAAFGDRTGWNAQNEGFAHVLAAHPQVRHQFLEHLGAHARKLSWMARELECERWHVWQMLRRCFSVNVPGVVWSSTFALQPKPTWNSSVFEWRNLPDLQGKVRGTVPAARATFAVCLVRWRRHLSGRPFCLWVRRESHAWKTHVHGGISGTLWQLGNKAAGGQKSLPPPHRPMSRWHWSAWGKALLSWVCKKSGRFPSACSTRNSEDPVDASNFWTPNPRIAEQTLQAHETAILNGWVNEMDRPVYAEAVKIFNADLEKFGVSHESCTASYEEADLDLTL